MTKTRPSNRCTAATLLAGLVLAVGSTGHADVSKKIQASLRGTVLITSEPLPDTAEMTDGEAKKLLRELALERLKGTNIDDSKAWTFHYTAFLNQPVSGTLSLDFHKTDKEKTYVANARLTVDGSVSIVSGRLTIDENEGPTPGTTYDVLLRGKVKGKEVVLARARITLE